MKLEGEKEQKRKDQKKKKLQDLEKARRGGNIFSEFSKCGLASLLWRWFFSPSKTTDINRFPFFTIICFPLKKTQRRSEMD